MTSLANLACPLVACGFCLLLTGGCEDQGAPGSPVEPPPDASEASRPGDADAVDAGAGGAANDGATAEEAAAPDAAVDGSAQSPETGPDAHGGDADAGDAKDAAVGPAADADAVADAADAGADAAPEGPSRIVGWSVRKRVPTTAGAELLLEEMLTDLASDSPKPSKLVAPGSGRKAERSWTAPPGTIISDFCSHPSGAVSIVLVDTAGGVSFVRLDPELLPLGTLAVHDPAIAGDPHVTDAGDLDLVANALTLDAARIASVGEDVIATVFTSWNSVVAYRASFSAETWTEPERTLVEPPSPLFPHLPIGGSFDTFGAITAWYRPLVDVDEGGSAYVAVWANPRRIRDHVSVFADGLAPLPPAPDASAGSDSDILLTKLGPGGARLWSRVIGTTYEDEPYAIRARNGEVAVVGRARRATGFDNTFWDAFIAVSTSSGVSVGARTLVLDASSIALAVDSSAGGGWVLGGSDGWSQNPDGLSVLTFGAKVLLELPSLEAAPVRLPLPAGPRHNEIRTVRVAGDRIAFGGHEDGPIMHTGDQDVGQIRATGVVGTVALP